MSGSTPNTAPEQQAAAAPVHVAAAAIYDSGGRVLVALRPDYKHQGGLWEFPGGKVEAGEPVEQALRRELAEELGIRVTRARPLIRIPFDYPDKRVLLDTWSVLGFDGEPFGREGQRVRWVTPAELSALSFPAANAPIVTAARLPSLYLITPEPTDAVAWLARLERLLAAGVRLVQLRATSLTDGEYAALARRALALCRAAGATLLLNAAPETAVRLGAPGVHLSSRRLLALRARPLGKDLWVAASCHNAKELRHAARVGVDFAVLSPICPTASHPGSPPLGWPALRALTELAPFPVYALGGMMPADVVTAHRHGAQGIAAIRAVWDAPDPVAAVAACLAEDVPTG